MTVSRRAPISHPALRSTFPLGRFTVPRACNDNLPVARPGARAGRGGLGLGVFVATAWVTALIWVVYQISLWAGH